MRRAGILARADFGYDDRPRPDTLSDMSKETLKQQLSHLHEELASGESLDPETRELLARVSRDIEHVLDEEQESDNASIGARIESAALDFEVSHPRLARFLTEITDTLAKLGV